MHHLAIIFFFDFSLDNVKHSWYNIITVQGKLTPNQGVNRMNKLHVSKENSKMGKVTSVSLTPVVSCPPNVPCSKICYAMGSYRLRQNVRTAWDDNYDFWASDPIGFFTAIDKYLASTKRPIKFFRWHVGGDIPNQRYLNSMCGIARDF